MSFDRFLAIDWTGAKGKRHRAIQIAEAMDSAPRIVRPGHIWARDEVRALIQAIADRGERTLIGIDCSFSLPFLDHGAYFPDPPSVRPEPVEGRGSQGGAASSFDKLRTNGGLEAAPDLWRAVDNGSQGEEDLAAAGFIAARRQHFWCGAADGVQKPFARLRVADRLHAERKMGNPCSPFVLVGASQVGKATLSGMRLIANLKGVPVWPFDPVPETGPLLVEIYCQTFALDGGYRGKIRTRTDLNAALARIGSKPVGRGVPAEFPDHVGDALVSAAGLRRAAGIAGYWSPPDLTPEVRRTEGWTFGIL